MNDRTNFLVRFLSAKVLTGFSRVITAAFPQTTMQGSIVHLVRHSQAFCLREDDKSVTASLKTVYGSAGADADHESIEAYNETWDGKYYPLGGAEELSDRN